MTSPFLRKTWGFIPIPTPAGVPVVTISPGWSDINLLRYESIKFILKIIFFVFPDDEPDNEDIDTMIDYFISTEEYEKCAILTKLKNK